MDIKEMPFFKKFVEICDIACNKGWHERNGGNMSYRLTDEEAKNIKPCLNSGAPWKDIGLTVDNLSGEYFLVTGSGKYFMNVKGCPEDNLAVIHVSDDGAKYSIVWGLEHGGVPTSELPTHLLNHSVKKDITGGRSRVIMHSHPANIVALTFLLPLDDKTFTKALWSMITECPIVFPRGVGVVPWMIPGGPEIALKTAELIKKYDIVIWAHHGVFCSGEDFDIAFGLMDTVEKAAEILIKVMSCGGSRQDITNEQILSLAKPYNVDIDGSMLE